MIVCVKLFAVAKQMAGSDVVQLELPPGSTVADLREHLAATVPGLGAIAAHLLFSVNCAYVSDQTALADGVDVACIPPVSGG